MLKEIIFYVGVWFIVTAAGLSTLARGVSSGHSVVGWLVTHCAALFFSYWLQLNFFFQIVYTVGPMLLGLYLACLLTPLVQWRWLYCDGKLNRLNTDTFSSICSAFFALMSILATSFILDGYFGYDLLVVNTKPQERFLSLMSIWERTHDARYTMRLMPFYECYWAPFAFYAFTCVLLVVCCFLVLFISISLILMLTSKEAEQKSLTA